MSDQSLPPDPAPPERPPPGPFGAVLTQPPGRRAGDLQADVDTVEIPLAELAEAAMTAAAAFPPTRPEHGSAQVETSEGNAPEVQRPGVDAPEVDDHVVDLAEAEREEAADLERAAIDETDRPDLSPIDPRIHERRVAVTRAEGRRRLRILLAVVSVASAIGIAWLIVESPFLAVDTVTVRGAARETRAAVEEAAAVRKGSALLFVDTGAVARRVEKLPWVAKATVDRDLPNGLTITVVERTPVAWVRRPVPRGSPKGTVGVPVLIDRSGRVLGEVPAPAAGLPELVGITRLPDRGGRIEPAAPARAVAALPDALRAQTGSVVRRGGEAVLKLIALPGAERPTAGEVRLGSFEEIAAKGAAALAVLDQLAAGGEHVRYVDVRVPGAPATR